MTGTWTLIEADVLDALRATPSDSFDSAILDPPYGLGPKQPTLDELRAYLDSGSLDTGGDFMGQAWSVPSIAVWRELLRVLKPGAPLLAYAGSRTVDLIALGIRAAGFEVKDTLQWIYGQSMPKPASTTDKFLDWHAGAERAVVGTQTLTGNAAVPTKKKGGTLGVQVGTVAPTEIPITAPATEQAKRWAGYGHALKPGHEPVIVARKPLDGSIAENILLWDVCGLNVVGCRLGTGKRVRGLSRTTGNVLSGSVDGSLRRETGLEGGHDPDLGRWPSNIVVSHSEACVRLGTKKVRTNVATNGDGKDGHVFNFGNKRGSAPRGHADADGQEEVSDWACVESCPIALIDAQSGDRPATLTGRADPGATHANPGDNSGASTFGGGNSRVYADAGGASRYFATVGPETLVSFRYMAKVSTAERELGCEALPLRTPGECTDREEGSAGLGPQAGAGRSGGARNHHPTLKRIAFNKWLATLVLPPPREAAPRRCLIPYAGAASEMLGAVRAGFEEVVGIEREPDFIRIAKARLARWAEVPTSMDEAEATREALVADNDTQLSLLGRGR